MTLWQSLWTDNSPYNFPLKTLRFTSKGIYLLHFTLGLLFINWSTRFLFSISLLFSRGKNSLAYTQHIFNNLSIYKPTLLWTHKYISNTTQNIVRLNWKAKTQRHPRQKSIQINVQHLHHKTAHYIWTLWESYNKLCSWSSGISIIFWYAQIRSSWVWFLR